MESTRARFPPIQRLKTSAEFGRVFAGAVRSSDGLFTVLARPNTCGTPRLGLAISRRAAKRAVDRNRLKRLAREAFRHRALPGWDFVVMAKPPAPGAGNAALAESLDRHFSYLQEKARARHHG